VAQEKINIEFMKNRKRQKVMERHDMQRLSAGTLEEVVDYFITI
jgi:hypothetical protein